MLDERRRQWRLRRWEKAKRRLAEVEQDINDVELRQMSEIPEPFDEALLTVLYSTRNRLNDRIDDLETKERDSVHP